MEDFELLFEVFGIVDDDPPAPISSGVKGLDFAFLKTMVWDQAGPGTHAALARGVELLKAAGANVTEISFPSEFDRLPAWHTCVLQSDGRVAFRSEYVTAKEELAPYLRDQVEGKFGFKHKDYTEAFDSIAALRPKWDAIAAKYAAVIVPSAPDEAPKGLTSTGNMIFNSESRQSTLML